MRRVTAGALRERGVGGGSDDDDDDNNNAIESRSASLSEANAGRLETLVRSSPPRFIVEASSG